MFDPSIYLNQANAKGICCACDDDDKQKLIVTPPLLYFSYIPVGEESEAQPMIITNTGSEAVAVQSIIVSDDFWIENKNVLPINLLPGKSVTLQIKFKPKDSGVRHCTVQIKAGVKPAQDCVVAIGIGGKHEFVADIAQMKKEIKEQNHTVQLIDSLSGDGGSALVGFLQSGSDAGLRPVQDKLRDVVNVNDFEGADFSIKMAAAIAALPVSGGIIYADKLAAVETISQQIVLNKAITVIFGASVFTVASSTATPAFKITRTSALLGKTGMGFVDVSGVDQRGIPGTAIKAGTGFTGHLIGIQNTSPFDQFNCAKSQVQDIYLDGNNQASSGVLIQGAFNVRLARLLIAECNNGIDIVNLNNTQGFSEATDFSEIYIEDPVIGIRGAGSNATNSLGHAKWSGIRINMNTPNSIGIRLDNASMYSSNVTGVTMWPSTAATNSFGIELLNSDIDQRTVFNKVYFENSSPSFKGWRQSGDTTAMPTIIATNADNMNGGANHELYSLSANAKFWMIGRQFSLNGDFQTGVLGWLFTGGVVATSVAGGQTGNCLRLTSNGSGGGTASVSVPVQIGNRYRVVVWFKKGTSADGLIRVGTGLGDSSYASTTPTDAAWTRYEYTFEATTAKLVLTLYPSNGSTPAEYSHYDSISIEEIGYSLDA